MKNVLVISYFFPPVTAVGGGVIRVLKFVKYLPAFGIRPCILTAKNPFLPVDDTLSEDLPREARVYRIRQMDPRYLFSSSSKNNKKRDENPLSEGRGKAILKNIFKFFSFPDTAWPWIIPALLNGLSIVKKEKIEVICVSAPPFSCIIIGHLLKKITRLPLVIDYRDLMSIGRRTHNAVWVFHLLRERIERFILKRSDAAIVTCPGARDLLAKETGLPPEKFHVITNGFDREDICDRKILCAKKDTFEILYAGYLYAERAHFVFFEAVNELIEARALKKKLLIKLIGRIDRGTAENNCFKSLLNSGNLVIVGSRPYRQTLRMLADADAFLVTSDLDVGCMLPGKIFEYMALGRPILAVGQNGSELFNFTAKLKLGICADISSKESLKSAISGLVEMTVPLAAYHPLNNEILALYERRFLTEKLAGILLKAQNTKGQYA